MSENHASHMGAEDKGFAWSAARPGAAPAAGLCKHALPATREWARHSRHVHFSESARLCHRVASCTSVARKLRVYRRGPGRRRARGVRERERERGRESARIVAEVQLLFATDGCRRQDWVPGSRAAGRGTRLR